MGKPLNATELAERIDAVDYDVSRVWNTTEAPPLRFTFRFDDIETPDFPWTDVSGLSAWTEAKRTTVRDGLALFETFLNLDFVENNTDADADFSFFLASSGLSGGRGRFRWSSSGEWDGWAVFNSSRALDQTDLDLVVHEVGHTLGLKHTGNYDVGGNLPPGPFLPEAEDNTRFSIMSYNEADGLDDVRAPSLYDIAALQARFGANTGHAAGADTYRGPGPNQLQTVWDAGGIDTVSARGQTEAVAIDLRAGTFSDLAGMGELAIAYGVVIERAVGGNGADRLTGNADANRMSGLAGADRIAGGNGDDIIFGHGGGDTLIGGRGNDKLRDGGGNDVVRGQGGNDRFFAQNGNDRMFGGAGHDRYVARGEAADFVLTDRGGGVWTIDDGRFTDRLVGIEAVVFTDDTILL